MVSRTRFSRRALLGSVAAAVGCRRAPKAPRYSGYCFVANQVSHSLAVVDLSNFRRWPAIPLDTAPSAVLAHPSRPKAFVLTPQTGSVYVIDAISLSVSGRIHASNQAVAMKLAPSADALWVLSRDPAGLIEIPLDSLRPRRRIRLAAPPDDFDLSSHGRAVIASQQARTLTLALLEGATVERTIPTGAEPSGVCFQWDGKQLLAASRRDRSVTIFQAATGKKVVRLPLPFEPRRFCFNSDGGQLFLTGDGMDAVVIVYPYQTEVAETVLAGRAPDGMAVTDAYLLVTNPATNSVTVLNIDDRKLVSVVSVGQEPREISITPDKQYALVLNEKSGDLAVIRLYSLTEPRAHKYKSASLFTLIPVGEKPVSAAVVKL